MKNVVWISFGKKEPIESARKYSFKTEVELEAFLKGVSESAGWTGWYEGRTKAELKEAILFEHFNEP